MTRLSMLVLVTTGWICAAASGQDAAPTTSHDRMPESRPPNFVFFLVDDLGWRDVGFMGSTFYETPNVDALAASGMVFTQAYAACQVCSPTRASIMTGKHPARLNTTDYFGAPQPDTTQQRWLRKPLLPARYEDRLAHEETTIAEALKEGGYATFFAGKWHLGPAEFWPEHQGFDVNKGGITRGGPYGPGRYFVPYGNPRLPDGPPGEHLPDRLAGEAAAFIEAHRDEPFLAYVSFYSVHTPLMAREDLEAKYEAKRETLAPVHPDWGQERERKVRLVQDHAVYAGMVEAMDRAVGKVVAKLEDLGLLEETVIIFMSDNGGLSTSEGHPTSNLPLRAGKGWVYEGGIREPMFVVWPGVTSPRQRCDTPVISMDFYPTMLEMAGLEGKPEQHVDGRSLVPLLRGEGEPRREALHWHYPHYGNQGGTPCGAIRVGDWKLIEWFEDGSVELYNLADDIGESRDRSSVEPGRTALLLKRLREWREEVGARMPTPNPEVSGS
jgi:arylsulfatase A-like enzyme